MAAKGCHKEVVELLADKYVLCASCAAAEAARKGCTDITKVLAMGHGKSMMQVRHGHVYGAGNWCGAQLLFAGYVHSSKCTEQASLRGDDGLKSLSCC
jgi:hypothetical protein